MMIRIFATSANTGERFEISDLYWFEENGVRDWNGQGHDDNFTFEFYLEEIMNDSDKFVVTGFRSWDLLNEAEKNAAIKSSGSIRWHCYLWKYDPESRKWVHD